MNEKSFDKRRWDLEEDIRWIISRRIYPIITKDMDEEFYELGNLHECGVEIAAYIEEHFVRKN